ncbi:hypothetical protein [Phytohalomonas tamaricis]|uniref:hypothetical protein n=1 Tax=Phytohalomonas tamaricis TaxID=2081032 RepID=UPI000D0BC344|nr:hypothetical protein [Phytohalomonas tamaricis]
MKHIFDHLRALASQNSKRAQPLPVIVCGLGADHYRVQSLLTHAKDYESIALIDDFPWNHGTFVEGTRVYYPSEVPSLVERHNVTALIYAREDDLKLFDSQTMTALNSFRVPFIKLEPDSIKDIDSVLSTKLANR